MDRHPYTHAALDRLTQRVEGQWRAMEAAYPQARGLPPLTLTECLEHLDGLIALAGLRVLTPHEQFVVGQLHNQLRQAVRAEMLGFQGRYYCLSEDELAGLQAAED